MNHRDPRIDPQPGDLIVQRPSGTKIRVTGRDGDSVSWAKQKYTNQLTEHNSWNIGGWRSIVAEGSAVLEVAQP